MAGVCPFLLRWCFVGAFLGFLWALLRTSWIGCFHPVYRYRLTASVPTPCLMHRGPGSVEGHVLVPVMALLRLYPLCHFRWLGCVPRHVHSGSGQPFRCRFGCFLWWQHCRRHRRIRDSFTSHQLWRTSESRNIGRLFHGPWRYLAARTGQPTPSTLLLFKLQ